MIRIYVVYMAIICVLSFSESSQSSYYETNLRKDNDHKTEKGDIEPSSKSIGVGLHNVGKLELLIDDVGGNEGWRYTHIWSISMSIDYLYWNWLSIGYSSFNVSDGMDGDWLTVPGGDIVITEPGYIADEEGYAQYNDSIT